MKELERTGDEGTDNHRTTTAEQARVAEETCQDGAEDTTCVDDGVVAPCCIITSVARLCTVRFKVLWKEDIVERIGET